MHIRDSLYRRVISDGGRVRYEPVVDRHELDVLPDGYHVVHVDSSHSGWRHISGEPDRPAVLAAVEELRQAMLSAMSERNRYQKDDSRKLTDKERRGLAAYEEIVGTNHGICFRGCTMAEVVDAGIEVLQEALCTPSKT